MRHADLTKMTKVEIVIGGRGAAAVRELIRAVGATGYTSVSSISGLGHHGFHQGRTLFNEHDQLELVITVAPDGLADDLIDALRPILAESSGVMFVSDTYVSRPDYFSPAVDGRPPAH